MGPDKQLQPEETRALYSLRPRGGTRGGQDGGVERVLGQELEGSVGLVPRGSAVRKGKEKRGGSQGRCLGLLEDIRFLLRTVVPPAQ